MEIDSVYFSKKKSLTVWRLWNCSLYNFANWKNIIFIYWCHVSKHLSHFFKKVTELFIKVNLKVNISLKHLVFDKEYFDFNYILAILWYSIYKSQYVSEQKTKAIYAYSLFVKKITVKVKCM